MWSNAPETLDELIEQLADLRDDLAGAGLTDVKVRVGNQPSYPLSNVISNIVASTELGTEGLHHDEPSPADGEPIVWIAVDNDRSDPYGAPAAIWPANSR